MKSLFKMFKPEPLLSDYSPPTFDNLGYEENRTSGVFPGTSDVLTPQQANERPPPPAYDVLINDRVDLIHVPTPISKNRDHRNLWDKFHEMYENSILQQLIWLGALVFAIFYIYTGSVYTGKCRRYMYDSTDKNEEDVAVWMKTEGGVFCGTVLFVFLLRVWEFIDRRRTKQLGRSELDGIRTCEIFIYYVMRGGIFIASSVVCIIGAEKIFNTDIFNCDNVFYDIYYSAKIGQFVVFASYAVYLGVCFYVSFCTSMENYMKRKFRFFGYLLDVDQDGVITEHDMKKTYEKLELIRRTIGDRGDPIQEDEQLQFFNNHIFKLGRNRDITVDEYASYLWGIFEHGESMKKNMRPLFTDLFNAFSTAEYREKEINLAYEDFARFWDILAGVDPRHCKKIFIRHFLNPTTMANLLEEFVNFLSNGYSYEDDSLRIFLLLKPSYEPDFTFERICRPSCCNV